jgi:hypothetical protein
MTQQSSYFYPITHGNLPFDGMVYIQLQIVLLYSQEHEANDATRERIGSPVNKIRTTLAGLVHSCRTAISAIHDELVYGFLTLQTHEWWRSPEICQITVFEYSFSLSVSVDLRWVSTLILQLHPNFPPELVILCEYCYHRHLENPVSIAVQKAVFGRTVLIRANIVKVFKI